jgi:ATP-binding cassette subfamily F protein uup
MAELEREIARLNKELTDPTLYARDPAGFGAATRALTAAQAALAASEEEWLTLEMQREAIEAGDGDC